MQPDPIKRTSEIEEFTNLHFIHPLAARLVRLFARWGVKPNTVSITGMLCGVLAAIAYAHYPSPAFVIGGFLLMIGWHVMDGADGQLARLTHTQSPSGKIIDGVCDYVTFVAVYVALAITLEPSVGGDVWVLLVVAGLCHAIQAAAYEVQRQNYNFWGREQRSAALPSLAELTPATASTTLTRRCLDLLYRGYVWVQIQVTAGAIEFDHQVTAIINQSPQHAPEIRQRYRQLFAPPVRRWSILSANYRTLGIFVAAIALHPLVWFWFEIFGLSGILAFLAWRQHKRYRDFIDELKSSLVTGSATMATP